MKYAREIDIEQFPRRNEILRVLMESRKNTTDKMRNEEEGMDLQEQHDSEEEMWPEGYTAREDRTYGSTQNNRTDQEHQTHRETVKGTVRSAGDDVRCPERKY